MGVYFGISFFRNLVACNLISFTKKSLQYHHSTSHVSVRIQGSLTNQFSKPEDSEKLDVPPHVEDISQNFPDLGWFCKHDNMIWRWCFRWMWMKLKWNISWNVLFNALKNSLCEHTCKLVRPRGRKTWMAGWQCQPESFCASGKFWRFTIKSTLRMTVISKTCLESFQIVWKAFRWSGKFPYHLKKFPDNLESFHII